MIVMPSFTQFRFRVYNDDGSESAATAKGAEDTNVIITTGDASQVHLRIGLSCPGSSGSATDDWQLQYSKNGDGYADVTSGSSNVRSFNSSNLTDAGATTNRLSALGGYTFSAGKVSEDGLVDDVEIDMLYWTELLFAIEVVKTDLSDTDTLDFRVLYNGATNTYSVTPRITLDLSGGGSSSGLNLLLLGVG